MVFFSRLGSFSLKLFVMNWVCGIEKWRGHQYAWLIWVKDLLPFPTESLNAMGALVALSVCVLQSPSSASIGFRQMSLHSSSTFLPLLSHQLTLRTLSFFVEHVWIRWVSLSMQVCSVAIFSLLAIINTYQTGDHSCTLSKWMSTRSETW